MSTPYKLVVDNPDPQGGKGYQTFYIDRTGMEPVTFEHLKADIKANPDLMDDRTYGPINGHWFEIHTEGGWLFGSGKRVIRQKK